MTFGKVPTPEQQGSFLVHMLTREIRNGVKKRLMHIAEAEVEERLREIMPDLHVVAQRYFHSLDLRDEVHVLIDFKHPSKEKK